MKEHYAAKLILILIFTIPAYLTATLLLKEPAVWPDEAIFADVTNNLITQGRLGTDLWKGVIPGVENHAYWCPPVLFYTLAAWFKLLDFTLVNQRLLSILAGACFVVVFYLFSRRLSKNKTWLVVLATGGLVVDFTFLKSTRISRPEIFVLFFGLCSLYTFFTQFGSKGRIKKVLIVLGSLFASFALLTHIIGGLFFLSEISYLLITKKFNILKSRNFYLFILCFLLPIFIFLSSIRANLEILKEQMFLASFRKSMETTWLLSIFQTQPLSLKIIYLGYITITLIFLMFSFICRQKKTLFLGLVLILSWIFSIYGKQFWYFVLIVPFVYLTALVLLVEASSRSALYRLIISVLLVMIFTNLCLHAKILSTFGGEDYSYGKFVEEILEIVPSNKTVLLSSIPDPYYGFKARGGNLLYEFPVLPTKKENYLRVLDNTDFIVYNGSYDEIIFGDFLPKYIENNKLNIFSIGKPRQYQTLVIELKPKDQRINP